MFGVEHHDNEDAGLARRLLLTRLPYRRRAEGFDRCGIYVVTEHVEAARKSERAMPMPMAPRPMKPTVGVLSVAMCSILAARD